MNRCAGRTGVLSALCLWLFSGYSLFCTDPAPLSSFRRSLCNCTLPKRGLFVEFGVKCIEITAVKLFLHEPEAFAESLVVDDLPLPQEADRITDLRIFYEPEDIIVGRAGLLFSGKVLVEIRDRIAF